MKKEKLVVRRAEYCDRCHKLLAVRAYGTDERWVTPVISYMNERSGCCNAYVITVIEVGERRTTFNKLTYPMAPLTPTEMVDKLRVEVEAENARNRPDKGPSEARGPSTEHTSVFGGDYSAPLWKRFREALKESHWRATDEEVDNLFKEVTRLREEEHGEKDHEERPNRGGEGEA